MERRHRLSLRRWLDRPRWLPCAALDIGEDVAKLSLGLGDGDGAKRYIPAFAVSREPQRTVGPPVPALVPDDPALCWSCHYETSWVGDSEEAALARRTTPPAGVRCPTRRELILSVPRGRSFARRGPTCVDEHMLSRPDSQHGPRFRQPIRQLTGTRDRRGVGFGSSTRITGLRLLARQAGTRCSDRLKIEPEPSTRTVAQTTSAQLLSVLVDPGSADLEFSRHLSGGQQRATPGSDSWTASTTEVSDIGGTDFTVPPDRPFPPQKLGHAPGGALDDRVDARGVDSDHGRDRAIHRPLRFDSSTERRPVRRGGVIRCSLHGRGRGGRCVLPPPGWQAGMYRPEPRPLCGCCAVSAARRCRGATRTVTRASIDCMRPCTLRNRTSPVVVEPLSRPRNAHTPSSPYLSRRGEIQQDLTSAVGLKDHVSGTQLVDSFCGTRMSHLAPGGAEPHGERDWPVLAVPPTQADQKREALTRAAGGVGGVRRQLRDRDIEGSECSRLVREPSSPRSDLDLRCFEVATVRLRRKDLAEGPPSARAASEPEVPLVVDQPCRAFVSRDRARKGPLTVGVPVLFKPQPHALAEVDETRLYKGTKGTSNEGTVIGGGCRGGDCERSALGRSPCYLGCFSKRTVKPWVALARTRSRRSHATTWAAGCRGSNPPLVPVRRGRRSYRRCADPRAKPPSDGHPVCLRLLADDARAGACNGPNRACGRARRSTGISP